MKVRRNHYVEDVEAQKLPSQWERRQAERERKRQRPGAFWIASFLLMVGGTAWFAIWPSTLSYWLGTSLYAPFVLLAGERARRKGFTDGESSDPTLTDG